MLRTTIALLAAAALLTGCAGPLDETGPGAQPEPTGPPESAEPAEPGQDEPGRPGDPVEPADPADPGDGSAGGDADDGSAHAVGGDLTIEVDVEGDVSRWTLSCDPPGGDHPDPEGACAAIAEAGGAAAFAPVPADTMCTQQWGGPEVATVTGTLDGSIIKATFERTDGCELARWGALAPLFGGIGAGPDVAR